MEKKVTSIKVDPEVWKEARKHCIDEDIEISEYVEKLIKKDLKRK